MDRPLALDCRYQYDSAGNITEPETEEGAFGSGYDAIDRLTAVTPPAGQTRNPAQPDPGTYALEGFTRQMRKLPAFLRESLTYDRGSEMACHADLAKRLNIDIWLADPYAPWQRGSNENANGLLRQFLPKGTDLSEVSQTQLNDIARLLNGRPPPDPGLENARRSVG